MNNIDYLLFIDNLPNYTKDEIDSIMCKYCDNLGYEKIHSICMEEFAELIEVITEFQISGKIDLVHLEEEITDCTICLGFLRIIFNYEKFIEAYEYKIYNKPDNILNVCINNLSASIIKVSKSLRQKSDAFKDICTVIKIVNETIFNLLAYFNIDDECIKSHKIFHHKIKRMEERNAKVACETPTEKLE